MWKPFNNIIFGINEYESVNKMVDSYSHKADTQKEDMIKRRRNQHRINWAKFLTIYIRYSNTMYIVVLFENKWH